MVGSVIYTGKVTLLEDDIPPHLTEEAIGKVFVKGSVFSRKLIVFPFSYTRSVIIKFPTG